MQLKTELYLNQKKRWQPRGKVILAQYDVDSIVVYQAYRPSIGHFAAQHGYFGGDFKLSRMTWIKPNFLWMMYRSGWGTKKDQEVTLAIRIQRSAFDTILAQAVHSKYIPEIYQNQQAWSQAVKRSDVRLQWDPDHTPTGEKVERRAIQLGLQGETGIKYSQEWIMNIEDISEFVAEQRQHLISQNYDALLTPREYPYEVNNLEIARRLQLSVCIPQAEQEDLNHEHSQN
ncbi:DUF4291 domain-containing protein [Calothrix sp. PCC 6303]|uniref:DUF4291 domain-containing protein n=1 Tax=Calothrix sp. PCC 6303 TaxID=1170562 RepID=UPI0002A04A46|nr:DUF4291 domain-containing protein [Calothrix sp. PCC 6303]AFZ00516.1 hypothetical protein Cal6303_1467 [Calothrix sp. PCC 6303]